MSTFLPRGGQQLIILILIVLLLARIQTVQLPKVASRNYGLHYSLTRKEAAFVLTYLV